jgi:hypothetical protein
LPTCQPPRRLPRARCCRRTTASTYFDRAALFDPAMCTDRRRPPFGLRPRIFVRQPRDRPYPLTSLGLRSSPQLLLLSALSLSPTSLLCLSWPPPTHRTATPECLSYRSGRCPRGLRPRVTPRRIVVQSATPSHRRVARAVFFAATAPPRRRPAFGRLRPCFDLLELHVSPTHLSDHAGDPSTTGSCERHRFPSAQAPPSWVTSSGEPPPWLTPQSNPPRRARAPSRLPVAPHCRQAGAGQATAGSVPWAPSPAQDGPRG